MIYCIEGTNPIGIAEEIHRIEKKHGGVREQVDGATLSDNRLVDLLSGSTLFADKRLIVVKGLAENTSVWEKLGEWTGRVSDDTTLVLVDTKYDKRTKTYKQLKAHATMLQAQSWTERDNGMATQWLDTYAHQQGLKLSRQQIQNMVARAYVPSDKPGSFVIDQMRLVTAVRSLALLDSVSDAAINAVMPPALTDSVYDLMEAGVRGNQERAAAIIRQLRMSGDPYMVIASLIAQWTQLVSIVMIQKNDAARVNELSLHPYVVKKMTSLGQGMTTTQMRQVTRLIASIDSRLKLSEFDPWDGIERIVLAIIVR